MKWLYVFKKSKKKQLEEMKYQLFLLRDELGVQKEYTVHLAETYASKEDFVKTIEGLYNYMIEKVREIEEIK